METITVKKKNGDIILIPVLDTRKDNRESVKKFVKLANGAYSKYVPAKFGFGPNGPIKY